MYKCKFIYSYYAPLFTEHMSELQVEIDHWIKKAQKDPYGAFDWSDDVLKSVARKHVCEVLDHVIQKQAELADSNGVVDSEEIRKYAIANLATLVSSLDASTSPSRNAMIRAEVTVLGEIIRGWSSDPVSAAIQGAHFKEEGEKREAENRTKKWRIRRKDDKAWRSSAGWTSKVEKALEFTYDERKKSGKPDNGYWESF